MNPISTPPASSFRALALLVLTLAAGCAAHPPAPASAPAAANLPKVVLPADARPQHPLDDYVPGVENFGFVSADVWRGARPTPEAIDTLAAMGVRTIINLELTEDPAPLPPGVRGVHLPVSGWHADRVDTAAVLAAIRDNPKPVFVHCREGRDRTGLAVAAYRLAQGMPPADAIQELHNFHVHPWWQPFIEHRLHELAGR